MLKEPSEYRSREIIIGVDPGTTITGYGVIVNENGSFEALDYGCIRPPAGWKLSDRYLVIFESLTLLLEKYSPQVLVVETQFIQKNVNSALKLGMARGTAILAAKLKKLSVHEYTPRKAKLSVVGSGKASKEQVQKMVQNRLRLKQPPMPFDASDALSLAICHAQTHSILSTHSEI